MSLDELERMLSAEALKGIAQVTKETIRLIIRLFLERLMEEYPGLIELLCFDILLRDQFIGIVRSVMKKYKDNIILIDKISSDISFEEIRRFFRSREGGSQIPEIVTEVRVIIENLLQTISEAFKYLFKVEDLEYLELTYT